MLTRQNKKADDEGLKVRGKQHQQADPTALRDEAEDDIMSRDTIQKTLEEAQFSLLLRLQRLKGGSNFTKKSLEQQIKDGRTLSETLRDSLIKMNGGGEGLRRKQNEMDMLESAADVDGDAAFGQFMTLRAKQLAEVPARLINMKDLLFTGGHEGWAA